MTPPAQDPTPDLQRLQEFIRGRRPPVLLVFSGGVDSTLLLQVAHDIWGPGLTALTFRGPHWHAAELQSARDLARALKVRHLERDFDPFSVPEFRHNAPRRCYACKQAMYELARHVLSDRGGGEIWDGAQADDRGEDRPGLQAAAEAGVVSPLREAGLGKAAIRTLSRALELPTWDRPSQSCLATRFPFQTELSVDLLTRVEAAEDYLAAQGFAPVRLRVHGDMVRLELDPRQWSTLLEGSQLADLEAFLTRLGWLYITLDLKGYRSGSMNPLPSPAPEGAAVPPGTPRW